MRDPDVALIKKDVAHHRLRRREAIVRLLARGLSAAESGALPTALESRPAVAAQPQRPRTPRARRPA